MAGTRTVSELGLKERWDHIKARAGYRRMYHRIAPGLYYLGDPKPDSPVFVSSNYTLSFDALRASLKGIDCHILVLDTKGINVWCAAGKGTFSTDEVVRQVEQARLGEVLGNRTLILPQLGAPGVSAHEVRQRTGFKVEYGPVRAQDIPEYLRLGRATEEMRMVRFPLRDRAVLIPVEIKNFFWLAILLPIALFLLGGWLPALVALTAILGGIALFPLVMPYLPSKDFTSKGLILGLVLSLPFAAYVLTSYANALEALALCAAAILVIAPSVAYMALNFTGCSTTASRTGVRREIFRYIPSLVAMLAIGLAMAGGVALATWQGWW